MSSELLNSDSWIRFRVEKLCRNLRVASPARPARSIARRVLATLLPWARVQPPSADRLRLKSPLGELTLPPRHRIGRVFRRSATRDHCSMHAADGDSKHR
jgi:hypothetical protein